MNYTISKYVSIVLPSKVRAQLTPIPQSRCRDSHIFIFIFFYFMPKYLHLYPITYLQYKARDLLETIRLLFKVPRKQNLN